MNKKVRELIDLKRRVNTIEDIKNIVDNVTIFTYFAATVGCSFYTLMKIGSWLCPKASSLLSKYDMAVSTILFLLMVVIGYVIILGVFMFFGMIIMIPCKIFNIETKTFFRKRYNQ